MNTLRPRSSHTPALLAFSVLAGVGASAASAQITVATSFVGDAGNTPDPRTGHGAVSYEYDIGTYEVTSGQYTAFLNAVARTDPFDLYNQQFMGLPLDLGGTTGIRRSGQSGNYSYTVDAAFANRPVNFVSFYDATRFANWMHNGQPTGLQDASTTEDGAYTLTNGDVLENTVTRNAGWQWAVASEDEWYKAAYYKGGNTDAGYWRHATRSNDMPGRDLADPLGNNANYNPRSAGPIDRPYFTTIVGAFQNSPSPYGTFDQAGNLYEWTESAVDSDRISRGGAWSNTFDFALSSEDSWRERAFLESNSVGFRLVGIPAPSSGALLTLVGLLVSRRRRAARGC